MREMRTLCVGCADGCHHCGRQGKYEALICDECDGEFEELALYDGRELCPRCLWREEERVSADG